jgi:hypothetical protein
MVWDKVLCQVVLLQLGMDTVCAVASVSHRQGRNDTQDWRTVFGLLSVSFFQLKDKCLPSLKFLQRFLMKEDGTGFSVGSEGPGTVYAATWQCTWFFV